MSKALRTAAIVVGSIALVATGVGAAAGAGLLGSSLGTAGLATVAAGVAKVATFAAIGLSAASSLTAPKPTFDAASSGTEWRADPYGGLPYAIGETAVGGNIVYRRVDDGFSGGAENDLQTIVTVLSCAGPVESIDGVDIDRTATSFNPSTGAASGALADYVWWKGQLGATPEAAQLNIAAGTSSAPSGWTSAHKLSGLAADMIRLRYDSKGEKFGLGEPQKRVRGKWVKVYDPRLDSTWPGGSGSCRPFVESTYVWSRNPHLHALTWAMGRYANGKLVAGLGLAMGDIIVDEFIEGANICDAYGWYADGVIFTRPQTPWNNLKLILAAGAAVPYNTGGRVGCRNQLPRVAVGSITAADLRGEASRPATRPRRERKNIAFYRFRSADNDYEVIDAGAPVRIADYVTADGGEERPTTVELPLVQNVTQAAVIAGYEIAESREAEPLSYVLGPRFHAFKPGDCLTDDTPEGGGLLVRIERRSVDLESKTVTLVCRTETTSKHARVLALAGQVPATITPPAVPPGPAAPASGAWTATGTAISDSGGAIPVLVISGASDNPAATEILFWYRPVGGDGVWRAAGSAPPTATRHEITAVTPGTQYDVGISYRVRGLIGSRRVLGPVTAGNPSLVWDFIGGANRPADGATRNEDGGGNLIAAPGDPATWSFIAGGQASDAVAAALNGTAAQLLAPGDGVKWGRFRVTPGEWLAYRHVATCDAGVPSGAAVSGGFNFFDRTGALLAPPDDAEDAAGAAISQAQAFNVVFRAEGEALVPAGAAFAEPYAIRTGGGGGSFYVNQARAGRSALGATRGAPAGTPVAGQDAATLVADAATAKADAASALSTLSFIADDSYLSRDEKPEVRKQRDIIIAEYAELYPRASSYSTGDVPSQTAYATAYANLIAYLDVLDLGSATDTFIVRSVFNFRFVEYFAQRDAVLAEIANIVSGQTQLLDAGNGRAVTRRLVPQIIGSGVIQIVDTNPLSATTDGSGVATISIAAHVVSDDGGTVSFSSASIGGLAAGFGYYVYEINPNYAGGARTYSATTDRNVLATPGARFVGFIITPGAGGSSSGSGAGAGFQTPGNPEWEP